MLSLDSFFTMVRLFPDTICTADEFWIDYAHNATSGETLQIASKNHTHKHHPPTYSANFTLPTLLPNASIHVWAGTWKIELPVPIPGHGKPTIYKRKLSVNHQPVIVEDGVARNGAIHVIGRLLHPLHHHGNKTITSAEEDEATSWENWEDWLPQWADAQEWFNIITNLNG